MKKPSRPPQYDTHIYTDKATYEALRRAAARDMRSVTQQALYYIKRGLEAEG